MSTTIEAGRTTGEGAADASAGSELFDHDTELVRFERSPLDVLRVLVFAVAAIVVVLLTKYLRPGFDGIEQDLTEVVSVPWAWLRTALDAGLIVMSVVAGLVLLIVPLVTKRFRLFGYVLAANVLAGLVISAIDSWIADLGPSAGATGDTVNEIARSAALDVANAAQLVAAFVVVSPFVSQRWRRAGVWLVATILILRIIVTSGRSTNALMVLTVGAFAGAAVLLAFGRPTTKPRMSAILDALRVSGVPVAAMEPASVDARGSVPYFATLEDGTRIFAKVLGTDQRAADLLFRIYRSIRLKNVGDERPFSSLRRTVEHEALVALEARDVGIRTPRLRCVAPVGADSFLLAYELIDGKSLDRVEADRLTDDVLTALWEQVAMLRRHRIAHRDLRLANVFLDDAGEPWLIDFGFSEIAASETLLRADVAQLLAALAVVVGAQRAVSTAIEALGAEAVTDSLRRLQPAALSGATQTDLKAHKGLLDEVRTDIERRAGVDAPELEPVTRFGGSQVLTLAVLAGIVYFLLPQLADLPGIIQEVGEADWSWLAPILTATAASFVAATIAILGSVPNNLPFVTTFVAQVGSAFANAIAPAGLGGMALNVRYLQRRGLDTAVATSSVGLNAGAGLVAHIALLVVFVFWARDDIDRLGLRESGALLAGAAVVAALALLVFAIPYSRRYVMGRFRHIVARAVAGLHDVLTTPGKLLLLFGGSVLVTLCNVAAFYYSGRAFGLTESFATMGAVYLVGAAIGSAAPTPGGLGAAEAALIAGLLLIGIPGERAVPTVFLFRLATFWVPILPGWLAFRWMRRTDRL